MSDPKISNVYPMDEDEIIKQLVPDPSQIPDARLLFGYLGKSNRSGYWRLYFTPELNEFVEIPEDDILHSQKMDKEISTLGGTYLWIRRESNLVSTRTVSRQQQAEFLSGEITARYLSQAGQQQLIGSLGAWVKDPTIAWGSTCALACPSKFGLCPTEKGEHTCVPAVCFPKSTL